LNGLGSAPGPKWQSRPGSVPGRTCASHVAAGALAGRFAVNNTPHLARQNAAVLGSATVLVTAFGVPPNAPPCSGRGANQSEVRFRPPPNLAPKQSDVRKMESEK
jgi:hypothetical protein